MIAAIAMKIRFAASFQESSRLHGFRFYNFAMIRTCTYLYCIQVIISLRKGDTVESTSRCF